MTAPSILTVGDNVVDCYPDLGVLFPGGNAVNVAVHARRTGAWTAYLGVLGTDAAGVLLRQALHKEGVDTSLLREADGPNAYAVVRIVDGNRVFESGHIGVSKIALREPDIAMIGRADIVHTGECSMVEDDLARISAAARLLSFDFSERPWDYVEAHARHVDIAVLSAPDGTSDPVEMAHRVAALGPATVAVTQGAQGATLLVDGRTMQAPAGADTVVDTLGAGDAFIARLLVGLARREHPPELLEAATGYATGTCAEHGAFGHQSPLPADFALAEKAAAP